MENVCESLYEIVNLFDGWYRGLRRGVSALPKEGEYLYPFCVETKAALILGGGGITGGMYELGALLFRADHPETDLLMIEPSSAESSLFLYGSMNFTERVHSLNYGYNSSVYYFIENFDMLRERFARHGMEVSLEHLAADRFPQQAVMPPGRHRFGPKRQIFAAPAR